MGELAVPAVLVLAESELETAQGQGLDMGTQSYRTWDTAHHRGIAPGEKRAL